MGDTLRKIRSIAIVVVLLGLPVLLLRSSLQDPDKMSGFDRAIHRIGAPLEAGIGYCAGWVGSFFEQWFLQGQMLEEKDRLETENREYRRRMQELTLLEEENRQLRRSLQMREQVAEDLLSAEVTGVEQSPFFRVVKIKIDRGDDFVRRNMAVLAPDGIVGRIGRAYDDHADVTLVTDPESSIAVEVSRSRAPGILKGASEDGCELEISSDYDVQIGDVVQTSGADELFPKGHPVGRIVEVTPKNDRQLLRVVPSVRFDRLDMVWVVLATAPDADPAAGQTSDWVSSRGLQPLH